MNGLLQDTKIKEIARVEINPEATAEEMQAIKGILERAGLLLDIDGYEIKVLALINGKDSH